MPLIDLPGLAHFLEKVRELIADGLSNITGSAFAKKTIESQVDAIYTATSDDGVAYTVNVPGVTSLYAGLRIHVKFGRTSASTTPTLNVNGLGAKGVRQPLSMNNAAVTSGALPTWLSSACPVVLIYNGSQWKTEVVRPSASNIYGQVPIANGGTGATTAEAALANLGGASLEFVQSEIARLEGLINNQ